MLPYARLSPGKGFRPLRSLLYYAQRLAIAPAMRAVTARSIAAAVYLSHPRTRAKLAARANPKALQTLRKEGILRLPSVLSPDKVQSLVSRLMKENVVGPDGRPCALADLPPRTAMAPYPLSTILACDEVIAACNNPDVLQIVSGYLHCPPTISSIGIRWSFPNGRRHDSTQRFHRDTDDWRFLKLFVYLTDVDLESGPHVYVKRSHHSHARLRARPYSRHMLEHHYGANSLETITGPRGTSFLADTFGIHRGTLPFAQSRLILQVQYSILPIYAFLYSPLGIGTHDEINAYVNRLLIKY